MEAAEIYFIETKSLNIALMSRIQRLKIIALRGDYCADAALRLIKKYGY
jgi:hypothetical protein